MLEYNTHTHTERELSLYSGCDFHYKDKEQEVTLCYLNLKERCRIMTQKIKLNKEYQKKVNKVKEHIHTNLI